MKSFKQFITGRIRSIKFAIEGWHFVLKHERNAWVHAVASLLAFGLGLYLKISRTDWLALIIIITIVWLAEFLNTSIEALVDLASPGHHLLAKTAKDVGAAAVLVAACSSVLVGLLIFGPRLLLIIYSLKR